MSAAVMSILLFLPLLVKWRKSAPVPVQHVSFGFVQYSCVFFATLPLLYRKVTHALFVFLPDTIIDGKVCPCAARAAGRAAHRAMEKLSEGSVLFAEKPDFITVDCDDMVIGRKLGEGGFSVVHEVILTSGHDEGKPLAIKFLKRKVMVQKRLFELGAADLATESMFLAALEHPHIIKYHGVTAGAIETNFASGKECGFFIIIDHLNDTLETKIEHWAEEANENSGGLLYRMTHDFRAKRKAALQERLATALQIANVMEYLHSRNVVYRDLKPENMAFDSDGELMLFDFGLAKELRLSKALDNGTYKLTGNTGSRRYMAPEVAKSMPYDKSVDVYSFGILLWELCAMEKPFYGYSANKHMAQVVLDGERPKLDSAHTSWWPVKLHWVLRKCWSEDPSQRPSFEVIQETLQDLIHDKKGLLHGTHEDEPHAPVSDSTLSMSHPNEGHGFASMKKSDEHYERAVTSSVVSPPPHGFAALKPMVTRSERAHTHSGTPNDHHRRKIRSSLGGLLRKSSHQHT